MPKSRSFLLPRALSAFVLLPALALGGPAGEADAGTVVRPIKPNIIVVMADDMRADDLEFAPNVRNLIGRTGLTFENSFSPFPLCCPARASFLTGQYAHNHKVYWHTAPYGYAAFDDSRTIGTALKAAGYNTAFMGKYLNGYGTDRSRVSGLPSWRYVPRGWTDWYASFQGSKASRTHGGTYNYWDSPYNINGRVVNKFKGKYQTRVVGDFSVALARKYRASTRPFFMYVSYVAPHMGGPREPDDPRNVRDNNGNVQDFRTPARPKWVKGAFNKRITRGSGMPKSGGPSEADVSDKPSVMRKQPELNAAERRALTTLTRQRAEAVYVMDKQVGRLVATLKSTGEWANTVIMFTSDNGYFLGEHRQRTGKVRAHEPSLRVPFVITGPGMRQGEKRYDPISTVDVTATVLDLAGAPAPRVADGSSRLTSMTAGDQGWDVPVVTEAIHTQSGLRKHPGFDGDARSSIGLRTARYSYTVYKSGEGELYDLVADPAQNENQFDNPAYAEVREQLDAEWWRFKDCAGDQCREQMEPALVATAEQAGAMTRDYWATINRIYAR